MKNANSHLYLYAKNHYKVTDTIEDLQKIVGERQMLEPNLVTISDITKVLLHIVIPYMAKNNPDHKFMDFIDAISPNNFWQYRNTKEYDFSMAIINKCLSIMSLTRVRSDDKILLELDKPDPNILPLKEL